MASRRSRRLKGSHILLLAVCLATVLVNCRSEGPRQGWNKKKWGPVVPHHRFPADCGLCHVPDRWDVLRDDFSFDHEKETGYPLEGAHAQAACLRCHNDRGPVQVYVNRGCGGCHPDPHTASLGLDCQRCHEQTSWRPTGLVVEHARTRFPLFGAHVAAPCESCHPGAPAGQFRGAPTACDLCHRADLARATSPNHAASGWTTNCDRCHSPVAWEPAQMVHDRFPLVGGHAGLTCTQCHTSGTFGPIPSNCSACHTVDYQRAPNHATQAFPQTCDQCHRTAAWLPTTYQHTAFPLTGSHAGLSCTQCHTGGTYGPIPSTCYSCHTADYQQAPNHAAQAFPHTCEQCHRTAAWLPATYQHTAFPLTGGHAGVSCAQCHTGGAFGPIPSTCYSCHTADYQQAPNHAAQAFPHTCEQCHSAAAWLPATYQHTAFPLTAGHTGLACTRCHTGGTFGPIPSNCYSCHTTNYQQAPDHATLAFSHSCEQCHTTTAWLPSTFRHTGFVLAGGHGGLRCSPCHTGGTLGPVPSTCYSCHTADYQRAPDHAAQAFPHTCEQCHSAAAWLPATYQHTAFPLTAGHAGLACTRCHTGGTFGPIPSTCYSCHTTNYQQAQDHATLAFSHGCEQCHTTTAWRPSTFSHTGFALTAGHAGLRCAQCHTGGALGPVPSTCYSCHTTNYQQAPEHATLAFSHSCEQCHTTTAWLPSTFRHTGFALTAGHAGLRCSQCHTGGTLGPIPSNCYSCHTADYQRAPDHAAQAFPHTCEQCHSTAAWLPAAYQHTSFPLTAGHAGLACTRCHTGGTFGPIPSNCYSCHTTNYQQAPDHATLAFSHSCEQCHTTTAWLPSTYHHTTFALTAGHAGLRCSQCHTGGTLGPVPSTCYSCHTTNYQQAPDHATLAFSHSCGQCHTTTAWLPSTFSHTGFALTAGHAGLRCAQCHTGGTLGPVPSACYSCHTTTYQQAPDHATLAFSHSCEQCHTTTAWRPSTFSHTGFALTAGHAGLRCAQCHTGGTLGPVPSTCYSCHTTNYQQAPNHAAQAFPHTCEQCHSTAAWLPTTYQHTSFPLTAGHAGRACTQCHTGGTFGPIPSACYSCHAANYQQAPDHATLAFSHSCEQCHTTTAWRPSTFHHTAFALTAGHGGLRCSQCHTGGALGAIPSNCYSCHTANYQAAPDHATLAFSHSCEQCHTTTAWRPSTFHHTGFALTAGHAGLRCSQCHTGGTLGPVPSTCYSCHTADYQRGPSHAAQAFPHTCEQCHNTTGWLPATYQHTSFPLTAGHAGLACTRCHTGGTFGPIPSTCYSCHATRYQQAANHAALAFSHSCEQCHTTTAWLPSTFRHTSGYDSHRNATCTQCHTGGNASSFNCLTCHTRSSTDGDHKGRSGYTYDSPACYRCHPRG